MFDPGMKSMPCGGRNLTSIMRRTSYSAEQDTPTNSKAKRNALEVMQAVKKKMSFKKKLTTSVDAKGQRYSGSSSRKPSLALRGFSRPAASLKLDVDGYSESQYSAAKYSDLSEEDRLIVERLTFNVGGTVFYALKSTFIFSNSSPIKIQNPKFLARHWDETRKEYFFDRDPVAFQVVLNYLRTGNLHVPHRLCSPQITTELIYWGLHHIDIEPCCWKDYSAGIQSLENLRKLEKDRRPAYMTGINEQTPTGWLERTRYNIWKCVSDSTSSRMAKIYGWLLLFTVTVSISSFILRTLVDEDDNLSLIYQNLVNDTHNKPFLFEYHITSIYFVIDFICFLIFVTDYILNSFTAPVWRKYVLSLATIIDCLALIPDIAALATFIVLSEEFKNGRPGFSVEEHISHLQIMKFLRLFRLFRFVKRITGIMVILMTIWKSAQELISLVSILFVSTLIFASFVYYAETLELGEHDGRNASATNNNFTSVFEGCWWSLITLTTVGYGDIVPRGTVGQLLGGVCATWGVLLLGITIPTMVSNFLEYNFLVRYIDERDLIYLYRRYADYNRLPNIPFPDFL